MENNNNYETLDRLIKNEADGMMSICTEEELESIKFRKQELRRELFAEDDEDDPDYISLEQHREYQKRLRQKLEDNRHKAHKEDIMVIDISESERKELEECVSTSIVLIDPYSEYNKTDDELYVDEELRDIMSKYSKVKPVYYNPIDWRNAMAIVKRKIEYHIEHSFPWLTKDEAYNLYNKGELHELDSLVKVPKLMMDFINIIKDPDTLMGIMDGTTTLVTKKEADKAVVKKNYKKDKMVPFEYTIITDAERDAMMNAHRAGIETPLSMIFRESNNMFNRFSLPSYSIFANKEDNVKEIPDLDWNDPNVVLRYQEYKSGRKPNDPYYIANAIIEHNINNNISSEFRSKLINGFKIPMYDTGSNTSAPPTYVYDPNVKDSKIIATEQHILNSIMGK